MRVSREISLGSSLHRASTDALIRIIYVSFSNAINTRDNDAISYTVNLV